MPNWSLVASTSAAAVLSELVALAHVRAALESRWEELQTLQGLNSVSRAALENIWNPRALERVLPTIAALARAVTGYLSVAQPSRRANVGVAVPSARVDRVDRAVAALLAATSLSPEDAPELSRAACTGAVQHGENIRTLLEKGESSLPAAVRSELLSQVGLRPYLVVPVLRDARVQGLLIVAVRRGERDPRALAICRAAAWLGLVTGGEQRRERRPPARRVARSGLATGDAEIVLWLTPDGSVVSQEALQSSWSLAPMPCTLAELVGDAEARGLLSRAKASEQKSAVAISLPATGAVAEMRLVPLTDVDGGLWGYAALLRRLTPDSSANAPPCQSAR